MSYRDRRDSHGSSSRDRYGDRRSGPSSSRRSPSPPPKPRDEKELPESFGRIQDLTRDDDSNVLQRMHKKFGNSPLGSLTKCLDGGRKIKVWTRNFKEVRGICTGYVIAFDKHWNLIMGDVDEVYLRRKKHKTPFFEDLQAADNFEELPPRTPKERKDPKSAENQPPASVETATMDVDAGATETEGAVSEAASKAMETNDATEVQSAAEVIAVSPANSQDATVDPKDVNAENTDATAKSAAPNAGEKAKKKKRRRKKKSSAPQKRHVRQLFIRGDSIVMAAILEPDDDKN